LSQDNTEAVKLLVDALIPNSTLNYLELGDNHIRDGFIDMARLIKNNGFITYIGLQNNPGSVEGYDAIGRSLSRNTGLRVLNIEHRRDSVSKSQRTWPILRQRQC
jgi:hypothetical protein